MSILFRNSNKHRFPAYGQMLELALCCYVKGLELGHQEIYIEWQDIRFLWDDYGRCYSGINTPKSDSLPFTFTKPNKRIDVDETIDVGLPNCLYDGCEPVISTTGCRCRPCQEYIYEYLKSHNELPEIKVKKYSNEFDDSFILIHYRESKKASQQARNIPSDVYIKIIKQIRSNSDIKIYKIGEPSEFDSMCDRVFDYFYDDVSKYFRLVNECKMYIGALSGPWIVPIYMRKPLIALVKDKEAYNREMKGIGRILDENQDMIMIDELDEDSIINYTN